MVNMAELSHAREEKRVDWGRVTNYSGFSTENPASQEMPQLCPSKPRHLVTPGIKRKGSMDILRNKSNQSGIRTRIHRQKI